jgi:cell filamentation protein
MPPLAESASWSIHPFREGNGRAQREFIRQLGLSNGHTLNWAHVSREQMTLASQESFRLGNNAGLEVLLRTALQPQVNVE